MSFAKIVLGLPVEGPFDYSLPQSLAQGVVPGMRCWVNFGTRRRVGYIVGISRSTAIASVKPVLSIIDEVPVIDKNLLALTKDLAAYYCCSWGEAIDAALPPALRKGKAVTGLTAPVYPLQPKQHETVVVQDEDGKARWDFYRSQIQQARSRGLSAIVLAPDIAMLDQVRSWLSDGLGAQIDEVHRKQPHELDVWLRLKQGTARIVVGTRSAVFAPVADLGLIIVDEEHDPAYKQDQAPHYHARTVSAMRAKIEQAKLILGGRSVSLESYYSTRRQSAQYLTLPRQGGWPEIRTVDMKNFPLLDRKRRIILSRYVQDSIVQALAGQEKVLLVLNRKGFATAVSCSTCGKLLKCPRCNMNLVYYYSTDSVRCRYCNYRQPLPKFCPECKSGYIKLGGMGTEKVESELARMFPAARIQRLERTDEPVPENADIFVATQSVIATATFKFGLTCVLGIDNSLNFVDFRAAEHVFGLLLGLAQVTQKTMIIQTSIPDNYVFEAVKKKDPQCFYRNELKLRLQPGFPPYKSFVMVKLRGRSQDKVQACAEKLFTRMSADMPPRGSAVISVNPGQPAKLRGNYYWTILLSTGNVRQMSRWIRSNAKKFRASAIKVTVDVDPA